MRLTGVVLVVAVVVSLGAYGEPELRLGAASGFPGATAVLDLSITAGEEHAGVNAKLVLPEGVTLGTVSRGPLLSPSFEVASRVVTEEKAQSVIVVAYSATDTFYSDNGVLLRLNLLLDASVEPGRYAVSFASAKAVSVNARYALSDGVGDTSVAVGGVQSGQVNVLGGTPDDTDEDGLPDSWENTYLGGLSEGGLDDHDGDGFSNAEELAAGTRPDLSDTDGDGVDDNTEADNGWNPTLFVGDVDGNGVLDLDDAYYMVLDINGQYSGALPNAAAADVDNNGTVDEDDVDAVVRSYNERIGFLEEEF